MMGPEVSPSKSVFRKFYFRPLRQKRPIQHPHQRSVADLFRMAWQVSGPTERRDRWLSL